MTIVYIQPHLKYKKQFILCLLKHITSKSFVYFFSYKIQENMDLASIHVGKTYLKKKEIFTWQMNK